MIPSPSSPTKLPDLLRSTYHVQRQRNFFLSQTVLSCMVCEYDKIQGLLHFRPNKLFLSIFIYSGDRHNQGLRIVPRIRHHTQVASRLLRFSSPRRQPDRKRDASVLPNGKPVFGKVRQYSTTVLHCYSTFFLLRLHATE